MEETASSPCLFTSSSGPDSSQEISPPETESSEVQPQLYPKMHSIVNRLLLLLHKTKPNRQECGCSAHAAADTGLYQKAHTTHTRTHTQLS